MNKHDSEKIAGLLVEKGHEPVDNIELADLIIFNTCSVREHAAQRLYSRVSALKPLKEKRPDLIIAVGGCLAQQEGRKIQKKLPFVDLVFGTHNLSHLPELIDQARLGSNVCEILTESNGMLTHLPSFRKDWWRAWLAVTIGCDNFCTYCIVPYLRGRERSREKREILAEVERLAQEGVKEITLLGQNVNSYGRDLYRSGQFASLLQEIDRIEGIERIRFLTSHPRDLSDEIIEAVAVGKKICEHFHLPVQAGSDRILELMNRGYTQEHYLNLIDKIRENIPSVSITTDIIVGFPGETEEDFRETLKVVERARFDQAFTFLFSPREGTPAAKINNQVPQEVKNRRFKELLELQNRISLERNLPYKGKKVEVLVEGPSKKEARLLSGRTRTNKLVHFFGSFSSPGDLVEVEIEEAHTYYLKGSVKD